MYVLSEFVCLVATKGDMYDQDASVLGALMFVSAPSSREIYLFVPGLLFSGSEGLSS